MTKLRDITEKVRSKNAGPFWVTVDIFCGNKSNFNQVCESLSTSRVAAVFMVEESIVKRFEIASLNVVKFSLPRPTIQGSIRDRDMHGASWAPLLAEMKLN